MNKGFGEYQACPPFMGFEEERYVPQLSGNWTEFYTCIANGKRVYLWAYGRTVKDCCVMLGDLPLHGCNDYDLRRNMMSLYREHGKSVISGPSEDAFLLQAFIHNITSKGNDND